MTEAVARLPDTYREVILLRFYGGQSCAEISRDLGVPLGTVTKRLSRAYALLRERSWHEGPGRGERGAAMNCQECRDELAAYLEGLLDETRRSQIEAHMAECSACQTELQEVRELTARLARDGLAARPPVSLENAVMDRILHEQALQLGD